MKVRDYEYEEIEEQMNLGEDIKNNLIEQMRKYIVKNHIRLSELLVISKNNNYKLDFMYGWLYDNGISIGGSNGSLSGELSNYVHTPQMGKSLNSSRMSKEEEKECLIKAKQGDNEARNKFITSNLRLATWYVHTQIYGDIRKQIEMEDLEQIANMALIRAFDHFDATKGFSFSTYAITAMRHEILRELSNHVHVHRVPEYMLKRIRQMDRMEIQLEKNTGKEPTTNEIAKAMNLSEEDIKQMQDVRFRQNSFSSVDAIKEEIQNIDNRINQLSDTDKPQDMESSFIVDGVYLDKHESEDVNVKEYLTTGESAYMHLYPDLEAENNLLRNDIAKVFENSFSERTQTILTKYYGLDDGKEYSCRKLGEELNLSSTNVNDIIAKGKRRMRHPRNSRFIIDFVKDLDRFGVPLPFHDQSMKKLVEDIHREKTIANIKNLRKKDKELQEKIDKEKETKTR